MVDSLCNKWDLMRDRDNHSEQLTSEQFRDLARTETDDELFKDCCNTAKKEGLTLSEFMERYVQASLQTRNKYINELNRDA